MESSIVVRASRSRPAALLSANAVARGTLLDPEWMWHTSHHAAAISAAIVAADALTILEAAAHASYLLSIGRLP